MCHVGEAKGCVCIFIKIQKNTLLCRCVEA